MAGEWTDATLGDICELRAGSVFPPALQGKAVGKYPFAKVSDMNLAANAICLQVANNWVDDGDLPLLKAKPFPAGTTVFAKIGEALRANRLRFLVRPTIVDNNMMGAVPVAAVAYPRYFFYALSQFDFGEIAGGTALPYLTIGDLSRLEISLPPIAEQRAIANILGTLDDKIELNRRMSETLEAMARALFKSWFVDFDPVRAKAEGRDTGLPKAIADLVPDFFEDSELGEIPKGWHIGKVCDLATFSRAALNPGSYPAEIFDHYSLPAFDDGRSPKVEMGNTIMSNKLIVTPDSVLLSKLNPHIPRIWMPDLSKSRRSVCSTEFLVACAKPGVSREYLFSLFTSSSFSSVYGTLVTGTTGSHQRVKAESVLDVQIVIPPRELLSKFTNFTRPLFARIACNVGGSHTLTSLRDALLPKLISGELRVPEAMEMVA